MKAMTKKTDLMVIDGGKAAEPMLKVDGIHNFNNWLLDMEKGTVFLVGPNTGPPSAFLTVFVKGQHSPNDTAVMLFNTQTQQGMWANAINFPNLYRNYGTIGKVDPRTMEPADTEQEPSDKSEEQTTVE